MSRLTNHMSTVRAAQAVQSAYAQISSVQHLTPAEQVSGAAILFRVISMNTGIPVDQLLDTAARMEKDADTFYQRETKALRDYVQGELK